MARGQDTGHHPNRRVDRNSFYNRAIAASAAAIPAGAAVAKVGGSMADAAFQQGHFDRPATALTMAGIGAALGGAGALAHNVGKRFKKDED